MSINNSTFFENQQLNESIIKHKQMLAEIEKFIDNLELIIDRSNDIDKK